MASVVLVVTGKMEAMALHDSLGRIFPEHRFHVWPRVDGFTSTRLPPADGPLSERHRTRVATFATTLIARLRGGRKDAPRADFVLGIEDLELCNAEQPEHVVAALRHAVAESLATWDGPAARRLPDEVRERCSFHVMAPMTEAYFFADPAALARATAPGPSRPNQFDSRVCDVEQFLVSDADYQTPPTLPKAARGANDWRCDDRARHPKHYLEFLTDPQLSGRGRYDETRHGCDALRELDWPALASEARTRPAARFARSLLADLVDMLGVPSHHPGLQTLSLAACHPLTWPPPGHQVLRNL